MRNRYQLEIPYDKLTREEFVALIKALQLSPMLRGHASQRDKGIFQHGKMELDAVYFRGCYDSVGYLKKAGIL